MLCVLGDARDVAVDSRVFGFIPESSIDGRVMARIWPLTRLGSVTG
jgi:type IV secretory pathway protease TraF